jgi:hypothetical protein
VHKSLGFGLMGTQMSVSALVGMMVEDIRSSPMAPCANAASPIHAFLEALEGLQRLFPWTLIIDDPTGEMR